MSVVIDALTQFFTAQSPYLAVRLSKSKHYQVVPNIGLKLTGFRAKRLDVKALADGRDPAKVFIEDVNRRFKEYDIIESLNNAAVLAKKLIGTFERVRLLGLNEVKRSDWKIGLNGDFHEFRMWILCDSMHSRFPSLNLWYQSPIRTVSINPGITYSNSYPVGSANIDAEFEAYYRRCNMIDTEFDIMVRGDRASKEHKITGVIEFPSVMSHSQFNIWCHFFEKENDWAGLEKVKLECIKRTIDESKECLDSEVVAGNPDVRLIALKMIAMTGVSTIHNLYGEPFDSKLPGIRRRVADLWLDSFSAYSAFEGVFNGELSKHIGLL
jgi:hypothetical protein